MCYPLVSASALASQVKDPSVAAFLSSEENVPENPRTNPNTQEIQNLTLSTKKILIRTFY